MNIKRIPNIIECYQYLITFSYETVKTNRYREQQRTIRHVSRDAAIEAFKNWSKNQRTMSKVEILGIVEIENSKRNLEV